MCRKRHTHTHTMGLLYHIEFVMGITPKFTFIFFRASTTISKYCTKGILLLILNVFTAKPDFTGSRDIYVRILGCWLCRESQKTTMFMLMFRDYFCVFNLHEP